MCLVPCGSLNRVVAQRPLITGRRCLNSSSTVPPWIEACCLQDFVLEDEDHNTPNGLFPKKRRGLRPFESELERPVIYSLEFSLFFSSWHLNQLAVHLIRFAHDRESLATFQALGHAPSDILQDPKQFQNIRS